MAEPKFGYLLVETEDESVSTLISRLTVPDGSLQLTGVDSAELLVATSLEAANARSRFRAASDLPVHFLQSITRAAAVDPVTLVDMLGRFKSDSLDLGGGDLVGTWENTGSGSDATQATGSLKPVFLPAAVNGKPAVRFGGGTYLSLTALTTVRTVYVVVRHNFDNITNPIPSLCIGHDATADWVGNQGTRIFAPSGSVGAHITNGTGYYNGIQIPVTLLSKSPDFAVYSFVTAGNTNVSRIGTDRAAYFFEGDVAEIILCSTAHSTATRQGIESWLINEYGLQMPLLFIADGDSITADQPLFGHGIGDAASSWVAQLARSLESTIGLYDTIDCAVGGQKWADLLADDTTQIDPLRTDNGRPRTIVAAMCGTNDLPSTTLADMQTRAVEYYSGRHTDDTLVIAITIPARTEEAKRLSYNQYLRDNYTEFADALADAGGDARLSDTADLTYFDADAIHLNSAGRAVIAEYVRDAVLEILDVAELAETSFVDPNSYGPSVWVRVPAFMGFVDAQAVAAPANMAATGAVTLSQATGANQALYKVSLQNSQPGLRLDGTNDFYDIDSAEYQTIYVVAKYSAGTTFADYNGILGLTGDRHLINGVIGTSKIAAGTSNMVAAYRNGVSLPFSGGYDFAPINTYWIGSFVHSKKTGAGYFGKILGGGTRFWNGDILELIAFSDKHTDAQRKNVEGYLGYWYDIDTGSSYSPTSQEGVLRLYSSSAGFRILLDGNELASIDGDGVATLAHDMIVPTEVYGVGWNGSNEVPTKDAVYDKIEAIANSTALSVVQGLVSFWKLNEAAGKRYDSVGVNHLTDNNTVTGAEGPRAPASQFTVANSEFLSIADNADVSTGDIDFSITGWVYLDSKTSSRTIISKLGASGQFEYTLQYDQSADRFQFLASGNGTSLTTVSANNLGVPAVSTWYFLIAYHDATGNVIGISVNNGTVNTAAHSTGVFNSTTELRIGGRVLAGTAYHDGRIANVRFWKRLLTATEITYLYNTGKGDPA